MNEGELHLQKVCLCMYTCEYAYTHICSRWVLMHVLYVYLNHLLFLHCLPIIDTPRNKLKIASALAYCCNLTGVIQNVSDVSSQHSHCCRLLEHERQRESARERAKCNYTVSSCYINLELRHFKGQHLQVKWKDLLSSRGVRKWIPALGSLMSPTQSANVFSGFSYSKDPAKGECCFLSNIVFHSQE